MASTTPAFSHVLKLEIANNLGRTYACLPKGVERLKSIVKAHLVGIDPNNVIARPPPAKRRKKADTSEE